MIRPPRKPPRPKKCPECKTVYVRRRAVQPTCGAFKCEEAFALRKARKRIAREKYLETLQGQHKAGLLKPYGVLMGEAQTAFNAFIRLRDYDLPCISCGTMDPPRKAIGGAWDAGHYRGTGAAPELRFEPLNCHRQCKACNSHGRAFSTKMDTVRAQYRVRLIARLGLDAVLWIEGPHELKRYRAQDLLDEKRKWQRAAVELRKARKAAAGKVNPQPRRGEA